MIAQKDISDSKASLKKQIDAVKRFHEIRRGMCVLITL